MVNRFSVICDQLSQYPLIHQDLGMSMWPEDIRWGIKHWHLRVMLADQVFSATSRYLHNWGDKK